MIKANCLNCKDRFIGCHSTCEKYKHYKLELEALKQKMKEDKEYNTRHLKSKKMF